jgi:hypothetical protein
MVRKNSGCRSEKPLPHEGVGRTDNTPDVRLEVTDSFVLLLKRAYKSSPGKTHFSRPGATRSVKEAFKPVRMREFRLGISIGRERRAGSCSRRELGRYSVMLRSARSTRPTKIVGLPNLNQSIAVQLMILKREGAERIFSPLYNSKAKQTPRHRLEFAETRRPLGRQLEQG